MTSANATEARIGPAVETLGRIALCTQGFLYMIVGILALQVARGDRGAEPSQTGAIAAAARQPFGKVLLVALIIGLVAYALWRFGLVIRGEPGHDVDGQSLGKRLANLGRAAVYVSFTVVAVRLLTSNTAGSGDGSSGGGDRKQKSTATVLSWPGGRWIVIGVGLVVAGVGMWNVRKAIKRKFLDHLDLHGRSDAQRTMIEYIGVGGYVARGLVFGVVAWFLVQAGIHHDANETQGLDGALRKVAERAYGTALLVALAGGLFLFGAFRILDGLHRRPSDVTYS